MSRQPLGREEVARIAIALKGLDEYRATALNDLIEPAISFLRDCEQALEPATFGWFSRQKAAFFVTGNPRAKRALTQFNRYLEFVSKGGYLELWDEESIWNAVQYSLDDVKESIDRVDEWFCHALKEKFSEWLKIDISERQKRKAENSRKSPCLKKFEPVAEKP